MRRYVAKSTIKVFGTVTHLARFAHSVDNYQLLTPRYARCRAALNPWPEKAPDQRFSPT